MKSLSLTIGVYNALVWRTGTATIFGGIAWGWSGAERPTAKAMRLHLLRGGIAAAMTVLFFWGLARVPMAQAISLTYIAPLLALLLGAVVLGERVGARVIGASVAALGGVGVILFGQRSEAAGAQAFEGALAILASSVLYSCNLIVARVQSQAARPAEIAFLQSAIVCAILLLAAPWLLTLPPAGEWWKIVAGAGLATGSLLLLAWAYGHGETGYLATTEYTSFVYAAVLGWLVFGEAVATTTFVGAGIIVAACLYTARRRDVGEQSMEAAA